MGGHQNEQPGTTKEPALSGGVDGVMLLKRDRGRADAFLYVDGRDIEEPRELALRRDAELASWPH